jgi:hypothetical protein
MKPALGKNTEETEPALNLEPIFLQATDYIEEIGALERIRTSDRLVRSQVLYPAELRARQGRE